MPYKGPVDSTLTYVPQYDVNSMYAVVDDSLVVVVQRPLLDPILEPAEQLQP
jgi:hypothetical protein